MISTTAQRFIETLPRDGWTLDLNTKIRRSDTLQCPIEYALGLPAKSTWVLTSTCERLAITNQDLGGIVTAADAELPKEFFPAPIRAAMLHYFGLRS